MDQWSTQQTRVPFLSEAAFATHFHVMPNYTYQETYSRLELAKEQIEVAIFLFLDHRSYASALTLAGAAEEVIGCELKRKGKKRTLDWKYEQVSEIHRRIHGEELPRKKFIAEENHVRDALKHFDRTDEPEITCDLQDVSLWMLVRACDNARRLDIEIERFEELNNWFYGYVDGI
ncbi:MAG: hypothetical protein PHH36_05600 [Sideroxydans sp.]|nr:hypothetical protein [Sideroxydans sp.]